MPYYDYKCENPKCEHEQEDWRSVSDNSEPPKCEICGCPTYRHIVFNGAFSGLPTPRFSK
jgi:putative FmdB family regulatory protein